MAELLLGERLLSPVLLKLVKLQKVGHLVKEWYNKLSIISELLKDAEEKAMMGDEDVQLWLDDLRDLVYDIEELVDEIVTEEGIHSLSTEAVDASATGIGIGGSSITSKVRSLFPFCCGKLKLDHELRSRMKKIDKRLGSILEQKKDIELSGSGKSTRKTSYSNSNRIADSFQGRYDYLTGRDEDKSAILAILLAESEDPHSLESVIPIVGMGGIGKTTLVKSIFDNPAVVEAFPIRGWACVSKNFNMVEIVRSILLSLWVSVTSDDDFNVLRNKLIEFLSKEKFLIVLDDYCNVDYNDWERLHSLYSLGVKGSKVIVTTRNQDVAFMMTNRSGVYLAGLSESDSISLLAQSAFSVGTFDAHPHLKLIGEEIALKCQGSPLLITAIGGILRSRPKITSEWEDIRDSKMWNLKPAGKDDIFPALKLSYHHLPSYLKRCFVFCAIFPHNFEFDQNSLVLLWMAEGLVEPEFHSAKKSMRAKGREQFDELRNRSFFQRSSRNGSRFVMHDLFCDLAVQVAQGVCLNVRRGEFTIDYRISVRKFRHVSYFSRKNEVSARFDNCRLFKGLRTFLALPTVESLQNSIRGEVVEALLQDLTSLRTISLSGYGIIKVPECIARLKHLRYLDVSGSRIRELPECICTLYNFETLILKRCKGLIKLPSGIKRLVNLRYLDISETPLLKNMPLGLSNLKKLEVLSKFMVGGENEAALAELKPLHYLQEELTISNLQNVVKVEDARDANLKDKELLSSLILEWDASDDLDSEMTTGEKQVLELLQPHTNIIHVGIVGYGGLSFPSWIQDPSFENIKRIRLHNCRSAEQLPILGILPFLEEVEIKGMNSVCTLGPEFCGRHATTRPFQSLKVLKLIEMASWEYWIFEDIDDPFPKLIQLKLQDCPKLRGSWPPQLNLLMKLKVLDCPLLVIPDSVRLIPSLREIHMRRYGEERMVKIPASKSTRPGFALPHMQQQLFLQQH